MSRYRKRPVVVEATQWFTSGDHPEDDREWFETPESGKFLGEGKAVRYFRQPDVPGESLCSECGVRFHDHGWIDTIEDGHRVCPGDWIITGIAQERYPCKDSIFRATYEAVDDAARYAPTSLSMLDLDATEKALCHYARYVNGCPFCTPTHQVIQALRAVLETTPEELAPVLYRGWVGDHIAGQYPLRGTPADNYRREASAALAFLARKAGVTP